MAAVVNFISICSLSSPTLRSSERANSAFSCRPVCAATGESQHRRIRPFASVALGSQVLRSRSGNLLLGEKVKLKGVPELRLRRAQATKVYALQKDVSRVLSLILKAGRDGLNAGTNLVPQSVPRPLAQAGVALAGLAVFSFVLRSILSTIIFIAVVGGICYAAILYLTRNDGTSTIEGGGGDAGSSSTKPRSDVEALDEARRIMEKYK